MKYYKKKKVLVTGGTGFIGRNFVESLLRVGAIVTVPIHKRKLKIKNKNLIKIPADLNNFEDCIKVCRNNQYIIHAAGMVAAAKMTVDNPMNAITTNITLTLKILQTAMSEKVEKVLLFSSGTTGYPNYKFAVKESDMFKDDPAEIYYGYGWSRRYTELLGKFVSKKSNTKVAICRPTAVYGNYDNFEIGLSHVVPSLIRKAVEKKNPYVVWGSGKEIRDFTHVSDLVKGCLLLLKKKADSDPVNIGSGKKTSIKDLAKIILKHSNHRDCKIIFDNKKPTTIPIRVVSVNKAKKFLGFKAKKSLETGIKEVIEWYKKNEKFL